VKFDELLKGEMEKRHLTNYRLAKMSGVHQTTIANLLEGKKPQAETERKILEALGLDERCLIDETPQKTPAPTDGDGLTAKQLEALDWIKSLDDEALTQVIRVGKAVLGEG
jgi:transcriptional regulator with XRE-family HTH domain